MQIIEITEFLKGSSNVLSLVYFSNTQIAIVNITPTMGIKADKISLKMTVDSVRNTYPPLSKNQSNDKNDPDEFPARSMSPKVLTMKSGYCKFSDIAVAISCK
jgi:hypothetical protein